MLNNKKDQLLLEQAYQSIFEKKHAMKKKEDDDKEPSKKKKVSNKKPDADGDGVPDWVDKHPGKDDHKVEKSKKKSVKEDFETFAFEDVYQRFITEGLSDEEVEDCKDVIMKLSKGKFHSESEEMMNKVKKCKKIFSVSQDATGRYTVIIKDSAVKKIEKMYPKMVGKFKSAADCKKDVKACRDEKLK